MARKNHQWNKTTDTCMKCGITRKRVTFKLLMAISNTPPYDHYLYEQKYVYSKPTSERHKGTTTRPDCIL